MRHNAPFPAGVLGRAIAVVTLVCAAAVTCLAGCGKPKEAGAQAPDAAKDLSAKKSGAVANPRGH